MTICIGTICSSSTKAVVAGDRMVTAGDFSVAFEHDVSKMTKLSGNCIALTAGSALVHTDLFRTVKSSLHSGANPPISEIVKKVKSEYLAIRNQKIEEQYFKVRGYSIKWFTENQRMLNPEIALRLDHQLETYRFNLTILIVGVDNSGAHIYCIYPPCSSECFEALGYCSIGSGDRHADSTFISYQYTPTFSLKEALYISYEAKRKAESAVGVGKNTDMAIISQKGIYFIKKDTLDKLKEMYNYKQKVAKLKSQEIDKMLGELVIFKEGTKSDS